MIVEAGHPRDTTWDVASPEYLVYLWSERTSESALHRPSTYLACREFRLRDAEDVSEVLDWAKREARPDESVVIEIELSGPGGAGTVRLLGNDPMELVGPGVPYSR